MTSSTVSKLTAKHQIIRLNGANPYETAVKISDEFAKNNDITGSYWQNGITRPTNVYNSFIEKGPVKNCILLAENDKANAVGSLSLSAYLNAPMLLAGQEQLNSQTSAQLAKLNIKNVYLAGGTNIISESVEQQLKSLGYNVKRYAGRDAVETNRLMIKDIPKELYGPNPTIVNEDDWVQGSTVASNTKFYWYDTEKTYINPIFLAYSTTKIDDLGDISGGLNEAKSYWEPIAENLYRPHIDMNIIEKCKEPFDEHVINIGFGSLYSSAGLYSSNILGGIDANPAINSDLYDMYLRHSGEPYQVEGVIMQPVNNIANSLTAISLSAKYKMPIVYECKYSKEVYRNDNRVYFIGGTSELPDGSESMLDGQ